MDTLTQGYMMKKYYLALASTLLISSAFAQTPMTTPNANLAGSSADAKRDTANEKHIGNLHARLKITSDEETLWNNVANTMRDNTRTIDQAYDKRATMIGHASAIDDLNAYADVAQSHADSVKKLALSFAPLYAAMPDAQKKLADEVFTQRGHGAAGN